jgi:hypothetical protein
VLSERHLLSQRASLAVQGTWQQQILNISRRGTRDIPAAYISTLVAPLLVVQLCINAPASPHSCVSFATAKLPAVDVLAYPYNRRSYHLVKHSLQVRARLARCVVARHV